MATLTIRNLSERAHEALRRRAAENGRSVETEARQLIEALSVRPVRSAMDETRLRRLQARAIAAFEREATAIDHFLAGRDRSWNE